MVLGNVAMKKPEILFFDEPELNLHPALQTKFLTALAKYGMTTNV
jgi:predicted ATP-dependent endonuclease of OLD family